MNSLTINVCKTPFASVNVQAAVQKLQKNKGTEKMLKQNC